MASRTEITQERIINYIAEQRIPAGGRLPPEKAVAALCGVSTITARRALADLEANNVVTRIHGRGTFVKLDLQATPTLGKLLFISIGNTSEGRHSKMFDAVERKSLERGCRLEFIKVGSRPETSVMEKLDGCKGIILYGWVNTEWVDYIAGLGIPAVAVSSDDFDNRIRTVSYDYGEITRQLLGQLHSLGAKNIGMPTWIGSRYPQDKLRLTAYRDFMFSHDLPFREENLLREQTTPAHYYQIIGDFLTKRQHPLDAIILSGTDIYINMLNFLLENPHVQHPLTGVALLNHTTYQLEHAILSRTICAVPEREIDATLVETLFDGRAGTTRISSRLFYKGKTII